MSDIEAGGVISTLTKKDFTSDQEVRWCPGCGDYAILSAVQGLMPELGVEPHKTVFVSGIGCSGRFSYYMDTYGMHGIHGRAPALATGIATANPELSVWVVTGDGDGLSIGGNHLIHALRRNVNLKILLFNNQIYGLTKGQYSPTSEEGKVTKSSPFGSVDHPFNPIAVALGAEATFVARTLDNDRQHLSDVLRQAVAHQGTAFVEIYQNCNVFNDGAFDVLREKPQGVHNQIRLVHGQPIVFDEGTRCVVVGDNGRLVIANTADTPEDSIVVHDMHGRPVARVRARAPVARADRANRDRRVPRVRAAGVRAGHDRAARARHRAAGQGRPGRAAALRRHVDGGLTDRPRLRLRTVDPGARNRASASDEIASTSRSSCTTSGRISSSASMSASVVLGPRLTRNPDVFGKPICSSTGDASSGWPEQSEPAARRIPRSSSAIISVAGSSPSTLKQTRCGARCVG